MRGRFKKWAAPFLAEHNEIAFSEIDPENPFFSPEEKYLEIGCGKGDFAVQMSAKLPGAYLALERDVSVCGIAAKKLVAENRENVRVMACDFDDVYESLKGMKFDIIFLNFSDPWPKRKHWKRRLTLAARLNQMADILKDGGEIRIKTDNAPLYEWTLEQIPETKMTMISNTDHYEFDGENDGMSEYERTFRALGQNIHRIILRKE